jgi:hypothetical protein
MLKATGKLSGFDYMSLKKTTILLVFIFFTVFAGSAQDIELTGTVKPEVVVGETFALTYTFNGQGQQFKGPALNNFSLLSGPNTSTTSSIRSVNGRTSMSIVYTYSYLLQAVQEGTFEIPKASVTADHKVYQSNTLRIKVVRNANGGQAQGQTPGQNNSPGSKGTQQNSGTPQVGSNDVFLKAFISNPNPMQGEGIIITYKIFTKVPIQQIQISKISSFPGFWSQSLSKENEKFTQYNQTIDGQQYVVADIRKLALFPLKSGKLVVEPLEVECVAQIKRQSKQRTGDPFFDDFFNDPFFNNSMASVEKSLKSNPLIINVRPLPPTDKPADFSGAVGNFTFKTDIDKPHLNANEPINLKCTVAGEGNIQLIDKMNVTFPPDFDSYDPKITSDIKTTANGVSGSQTFEYLVIPRKPGKFSIKPITFSYYDLTKKKYVSLSSPAYDIQVDKGTGEQSVVTYAGQGKEDIKYIGSDIHFIKNQPLDLHLTGSLFFGSLPFYLLLLIPALLFIVLIILWKKQMARHSNAVLMRNRKATKVAKKRLRTAHESMKANNEAAFYEDISQALWGYLSDKFSIPLAELSMDSVSQALVNKNVREEIIDQFKSTLINTEFARFAPGEKTMMMEKIYNEALDAISKNERELR